MLELSKQVFGHGSADSTQKLSEVDVRLILDQFFAANDLSGLRILIAVPDSTRTMPMGLFFRLFHEKLQGIAAKMDLIIALGTHLPMNEVAICNRLEITAEERASVFSDVEIYNHEWDNPDIFLKVGEIGADEVERLTFGTVKESVPVEINCIIMNYDLLMVLGPVFPHEVVGFSGGTKYFFPGIAAPAFINLTHWIGALNTCYDTIGVLETPGRELLERAASWLPKPYLFCCPVVKKDGIYGLYAGTPFETWKSAADLSAQIHVQYAPKAYKKVISVMPHLYDDIWTAAKGMYKLEPVVADGGEIIIYAPHIDEVSYSHGKILDKIGYHCRDFFLQQWEKYKDEPWGVLAHSTHLTGLGTYENGREHKRIKVTLATAIPAERCAALDLGYADPAQIDPQDYANREEEGILLVPYAGEILYRLSK